MDETEVIARCDLELMTYIEDVNRGIPAFYEKNRVPYEPLLKAAHAYCVFMSYAYEKMELTGRRTEPIILYFQIASCLEGLVSCLTNGQQYPSYTLLRAIFEAEVTLALLLEANTESRCNLYTEYAKVGRWDNMKAYRELVSENKITPADFDKKFTVAAIKSIEDEYATVKSHYHPKTPGTYGWAWSIFATSSKSTNPSLKGICKRLGRLKDYTVLYSTLSTIAHTASPSSRVITASNGMITPGPMFDARTREIVMTALGFCHQALEHIEEYLEQPVRDELKLYSCVLYGRTYEIAPTADTD